MLGTIAYEKITQERQALKDLAFRIWENPEPSWREHKAAEWTAQFLEQYGFTVERNYVGLKTAIHAVWGSGKPEIGFCGEYDALPALSQERVGYRKPVVENGYGHGCGHNLLGVANVAAVIGIKEEMEKKGLTGTIHFYGTPAEEAMDGKGFMVRNGAFKELDTAVFWHPCNNTYVLNNTMLACMALDIKYLGKTAHASASPQNGRSALDAVELCNVGANYLREHVPGDVRIHYMITDGGTSANTVPGTAASHYIIRAASQEVLKDVETRIRDIAQGAALMTGTKVTVEVTGACYNTLNMATLADVLEKCLYEAPRESWSEEDIALAHEMNQADPMLYGRMIGMMGMEPGTELADKVGPMATGIGYASGDPGDVMNMVPSVAFMTATAPVVATPHCWQMCCASGTEIGIKGMLYAANTMALYTMKLVEDPSIIAAAKEEFAKRTKGKKYINSVTDDRVIPE